MTTDLVGKTLGEYELQGIIGEGGMAVVYKGFQKSLQRWVAIKVLYYQEANSLIRFQREAKAIAALRHQNILIIYEYGEQDGSPYIVMEYVDGGTLEDRLHGQPMAWKEVIALIIPIAEALHYAHQHGIIHRDIKPSNVLMPQDDWPVLADFGLVKRSDEEQGLTLSGTFMGTPSYIAPEQARDAKADHRADMYSLGVMMFEMVAGRLPFDHENPNKVLLAHVMEPPPSPRKFNPDCPPALENVILKTLSNSPDNRYADMQELVNVLKAVRHAPPPTVEDKGATITPSAKVKEKPQENGGLFGPVKKLFGRKQHSGRAKSGEDTGSKTSPRPQVNVPGADLSDEELEGTVQIKLGQSSGQAGPRLILQDKNITINLPQSDTLTLGRTYRNNIVDIDLEPYEASKYGVSRRHARLFKQGDLWLLEDMNSLNGTFVNNTEAKHGNPVVLKDGDTVRLSHMKFIFMQG